MSSTFHRLVAAATLCATFAATSALALPFGSKDKEASAKITHGGAFKGKSAFALGAFRVSFITEDKVTSVAKGMLSGGGGASSLMSGTLVGVDHALMQKITDAIYADFLKQAAAKGYTVTESTQLAQNSASYKAMATATNFSEGRLGTIVIPTGQTSVPLPADNSAKLDKGAQGFMSGFKNLGNQMATAEANKAFPAAAKESGTPILGVTIVVNFADFKGYTSTFGSSAKATIMPGATIEGTPKGQIISSTSILGWDGNTPTCANCESEVILENMVHSTESIGALDSHSNMKTGDYIANGIGALGGVGVSNKRGATITADPVAYEKNVLIVAAQATDILLTAIAKEK